MKITVVREPIRHDDRESPALALRFIHRLRRFHRWNERAVLVTGLRSDQEVRKNRHEFMSALRASIFY